MCVLGDDAMGGRHDPAVSDDRTRAGRLGRLREEEPAHSCHVCRPRWCLLDGLTVLDGRDGRGRNECGDRPYDERCEYPHAQRPRHSALRKPHHGALCRHTRAAGGVRFVRPSDAEGGHCRTLASAQDRRSGAPTTERASSSTPWLLRASHCRTTSASRLPCACATRSTEEVRR
jgi:hypothetical protein